MAGQLQLMTSGIQDRYFTRNPDYSHFVEAHRKHANFSIQHIDMDPENGEADFGKKVRFKIPQNQGDLLKTLSVKMTLPEIPGLPIYIESVGHAIIDHVDLLIGGTIVQRLTSDYLQIYSEHNVTQTKQKALEQLVGKYSLRTSDKKVGEVVNSKGIILGSRPEGTFGADSDENFFVDLPFYFYNHSELAIPLCAITKQEVEVEITLRKAQDIMVTLDGGRVTSPPEIHIKEFKLCTEVVFLDTAERKKMQKMKKDYIITQLQENVFDVGENVNEGKFHLDFRNPVKELYFVIQRHGDSVTPFDYDNTELTIDNKRILYENLDYLTLTFDGEDIITQETGTVLFLKAVQAAIHHSKTQLIRRFYSYSFALQPEESYPTGQVNLSNIKEQVLYLKLTPCPNVARQIRVYAQSHNILRVGEGIAKTLFTLKY
jgi:hypothetical protein